MLDISFAFKPILKMGHFKNSFLKKSPIGWVMAHRSAGCVGGKTTGKMFTEPDKRKAVT